MIVFEINRCLFLIVIDRSEKTETGFMPIGRISTQLRNYKNIS